jgi:hypothetical protein
MTADSNRFSVLFPEPLMSKALNPMVNLYQSYLEASGQFAAVAFSVADKMSHSGLMAAHHALNEQLKFAHACMTAPDDQEELENFHPAYFSHESARIIDSQNEMVRLATQMQKEFSDMSVSLKILLTIDD